MRVEANALHADASQLRSLLLGSANSASAAAAEDASVAAAAAQLVSTLTQGAAAKTSARLVPAAPDGLPLFGYAPGFEQGRILVAVGEMQHALGFARSGALPCATLS